MVLKVPYRGRNISNQRNLIVINDSALARGGATALAIESAVGAAKADWNVTFFTRKHNTPDKRLTENGVRLYEVEGQTVSGQSPAKAFVSGIWNASAKSALSKLIDEHDMSRTVLHVHNWAHFLSPSIFEPMRPYQQQIVMSTHDFFLTCGNGGQFNYQTRQPCQLVGNSPQCLSTRCDKRNSVQKIWRVTRHKTRKRVLPSQTFEGTVAVVHNKQKPFFERAGFGADNIIELRNPITPLTQRRVKAENNKSILFIGRLDVEKGADVAAEAAKLAGSKIVFAGEGPLKDSIQDAYDNVVMEGFCDRSRLRDLIKDARLLIMPSWLETFGLAAVEALWSGVPVLMSQNALLSEDIVRRNAGISIDPSDVNSISQTIKSLAHDDKKIKLLSENAFSNSADIANTPESWIDAHLHIYQKKLSLSANRLNAESHKVALLNVHYSANLGDGLLSDCLAFGLQQSSSNLECFPVDLAGRESITTLGGAKRGAALKILAQLPGPLRQAAISPLQSYYLKKLWFPHYIKKLEGVDSIVLGGGNLIVDQDLNFPVKIHAALQVARRNNIPVHIYGVGVGSNFSPKALSLFRDAFKNCDLKSVTVRDEASRASWDQYFAPYCGQTSRVVYDPGIISSRCWPNPPAPKTITRSIDCAIGIMSPNELNYHNDGKKFVDLHNWYLKLINTLKSQGLNIVLFSNGSPEDTRYIHSHLAPNVDAVDVFIPNDQKELTTLLANADLTIAFRLHAIIPATSYGKHVIGLEWDKKIRSFMSRIGKSKQCLNMRETKAIDAAQLCIDVLKQTPPISQYARDASDQMKELASEIVQQVNEPVKAKTAGDDG